MEALAPRLGRLTGPPCQLPAARAAWPVSPCATPRWTSQKQAVAGRCSLPVTARPRSCAAAAADSDSGGNRAAPRQRRTADELVERASAVLERIVTQFNELAFLEDGAAEVDGTKPERSHAAILRDVVRAELLNLDEQFLAALNGYINAASLREDAPLTKLLISIRQETLLAVSEQLPPEVQVVELLTQASDVATRARILDLASRGGGELDFLDAPVPSARAEDVENAASRLVEQMEDTDAVVADVQLLVRVALAREAAREAMQRARPGPVPVGVRHLDQNKVITAAFPPSQLPRWEMALLKELVNVADTTVRRGLLQFAMTQALPLNNKPDSDSVKRSGMKPIGIKPASSMSPLKRTTAGTVSGKDASTDASTDGPPPVRPGRFLDCVTNLLVDLAVADGATSAAQLAQDPVASRVLSVRDEALAVLEDMAQFKD